MSAAVSVLRVRGQRQLLAALPLQVQGEVPPGPEVSQRGALLQQTQNKREDNFSDILDSSSAHEDAAADSLTRSSDSKLRAL